MTIYLKKVKKAALHLAVENNNIEVVKSLLTKTKIDINMKCHYCEYIKNFYNLKSQKIYKTALHIAIENNNYK